MKLVVDTSVPAKIYLPEPDIATCRFHMTYRRQSKASRDPQKVERGELALDSMEQHLTGRKFLVCLALTIADIALIAYTRVADEGGFDLSARPNIRKWIETCGALLKLQVPSRPDMDFSP